MVRDYKVTIIPVPILEFHRTEKILCTCAHDCQYTACAAVQGSTDNYKRTLKPKGRIR